MKRVSSVNGDAGTLMFSEFLSFAMDIPSPCLLAAHMEKDAKLATDAIWAFVGLFDDPKICDLAQKHVTDAGYGIKPCKQWFPRF